jgi:hypothetical protein
MAQLLPSNITSRYILASTIEQFLPQISHRTAYERSFPVYSIVKHAWICCTSQARYCHVHPAVVHTVACRIMSDAAIEAFSATCWNVRTYINHRLRRIRRKSCCTVFTYRCFTLRWAAGELSDSFCRLSGLFQKFITEIPKDVWGVYVFVLEKPNYDPLPSASLCRID